MPYPPLDPADVKRGELKRAAAGVFDLNTAPPVPTGEASQRKYVEDIKAAITPGSVEKPEPLDEVGIEQFLQTNNNSKEAQEFIAGKREKHRLAEEAFNAHQVNRSGRNALVNNPDGSPGAELKSLLADSLAQLRRDGYLT